MDRRDFLKILGVTSSTAMISSCGVDKANEKIIPYVIPPKEDVYPGKPLVLQTTCTECPANCGVQVQINEKVYHDQRNLFPTKLDGNPAHPLNQGALCARGQAGLFRLYHPKRIKRPMMRDEAGNFRIATWKEVLTKIEHELQSNQSTNRTNVFLSGRTTGTLSTLINEFCQKTFTRRLPEYEVFSHSNLKQANEILYSKPEIPKYNIDKCDFLFSVGADLFETFLNPVESAAQYAAAKQKEYFSWYHVEPHLSLTGVQADERLVVKPESEMVLLVYLIQTLLEKNKQKNNLSIEIIRALPTYPLNQVTESTGLSKEQLEGLTEKLSNTDQPLVIAGGISTAQDEGLEVAVLAGILQYMIGTDQERIDFARSHSYQTVGTMKDVQNLATSLDNEAIGVMFISRTDPVKTLPKDLDFNNRMKKAQLTVIFSDVITETSQNADIILPTSHSLESWGDTIPEDGLTNFIQPALEPQFDSRMEGDILLQLMGKSSVEENYFKTYLKEKWNRFTNETNSETYLKAGFYRQHKKSVAVQLQRNKIRQFLQKIDRGQRNHQNWLCITPSIRTFDGRSRDLSLLNEIPDPLTTISYGDWVSVSGKTAEKLGLQDRDEVQISIGSSVAAYPVKVMKLLPPEVWMIQRDIFSDADTSVDSRSGELSWYLTDIEIKKTGNRVPMPILAGSMDEEGRGLLPHEDEHGHGHEGEHEEWYPEHEHENYRWGMAIDLESCIGCNACTAACYVENNVPIVGKEAHLLGREMSWIRIQPYYEDTEKIEFVPMLCQHCGNAPCEPVCPVYAAYHNPEGLNVQVYNRCVGTRYCANNCPYKVRRFNWFDHRLEAPLDKMYNPAVSVRDRGIMEKCTFCIHRIRSAKDLAKDENRLVADGEVVPACAQTCPTNAITFGNLDDKNSKVYQLAHSERAYHALEELGTKPAISYLWKKRKHNEA
jgi:molybdopterin-containing oxidoreductase family iron-sulfur binding subunit